MYFNKFIKYKGGYNDDDYNDNDSSSSSNIVIVIVIVILVLIGMSAAVYFLFQKDPIELAPASTTPVSTTPVSTIPASTIPDTSTPVSTIPASTIPASNTPVTTVAGDLLVKDTKLINGYDMNLRNALSVGCGGGNIFGADCGGVHIHRSIDGPKDPQGINTWSIDISGNLTGNRMNLNDTFSVGCGGGNIFGVDCGGVHIHRSIDGPQGTQGPKWKMDASGNLFVNSITVNGKLIAS
jgi:flagellar basal body-associated protein FliL